MNFKEIRERLANRDLIREKQEMEERAEAEREIQAERAKRAQVEIQATAAAVATAKLATQATTTTTAAADTSSEVAKKVKERFLRDTSKVIVKVLGPYKRVDAKKGQITSTEDFKHLAKKVFDLTSC